MKSLYPPTEPYDHGHLQVSDRHAVYYEQCGNPDGKPVVFLHGGPGGGCDARSRRYFDPAAYRIVLFDQRGCGRSTPHACLEDNDTWKLISDIERLRDHLRIERWQVFGGSWGSTLALLYAQTHTERVNELVLRGIFLLRRAELDWFYQDGAAQIFPEAWAEFVAPIPPEERDDLLAAYHRRITGPDAAIAIDAAKSWARWEAGTSMLRPSQQLVDHFTDDKTALAMATLETHYFVNAGFLECDGQIIRDADRLRGIPGVIVQGRYDVVCTVRNAWDLSRAWPDAELRIVPDAGHSATETGIIDGLITATDEFAHATP